MIKIQDVLRAGHIKRWNIINTTRQQTLAEHLFNVAMIADGLLSKLGITEYRDITLAWALIHDVPEVVCGDTPTPTKKRMNEHNFSMEKIYDEIDPTYKETKETAMELCIPYDLVKIADLMEAVHFLTENGVGGHAKEVANGIHKKLMVHIDSYAETYDNYEKDRAVLHDSFNEIMVGKIYE